VVVWPPRDVVPRVSALLRVRRGQLLLLRVPGAVVEDGSVPLDASVSEFGKEDIQKLLEPFTRDEHLDLLASWAAALRRARLALRSDIVFAWASLSAATLLPTSP
jgi:hypothetical protein